MYFAKYRASSKTPNPIFPMMQLKAEMCSSLRSNAPGSLLNMFHSQTQDMITKHITTTSSGLYSQNRRGYARARKA